jgi:hypothetical protein
MHATLMCTQAPKGIIAHLIQLATQTAFFRPSKGIMNRNYQLNATHPITDQDLIRQIAEQLSSTFNRTC